VALIEARVSRFSLSVAAVYDRRILHLEGFLLSRAGPLFVIPSEVEESLLFQKYLEMSRLCST